MEAGKIWNSRGYSRQMGEQETHTNLNNMVYKWLAEQ